MSEALIELSNALAAATERAAAHTVAVHTGPRGSSSGVIGAQGLSSRQITHCEATRKFTSRCPTKASSRQVSWGETLPPTWQS